MDRGRAFALIAALALASCGEDGAQQAQQAPPPGVIVAKAESRDLRPSDEFTGRVEARDQVDILARVEGFLERRAFAEGQIVKAGGLLFRLEQAPFLATLQQREADLLRARAEERNAKAQLDRATELVRTGNIPRSEVDNREAAHLVALAAIKQAEAAVEVARIDLGYTEIRAPISGRIGVSTFTEGALVGPRSPPLAVIVSSDPIFVTFPVSQRQLLGYRRKAEAEGQQDVTVWLRLADGSRYSESGRVDFLDIRADPGTDTVSVRASFPNPQGLLVPGQFAGVTVESTEAKPTIVVPQAALQIDQTGPFVMLVDGDAKVALRRIRIGAAVQDAVVVEQGLQAGDRVVIEGVQKIRPGQEVQVSEQPAPGRAGPGGPS